MYVHIYPALACCHAVMHAVICTLVDRLMQTNAYANVRVYRHIDACIHGMFIDNYNIV